MENITNLDTRYNASEVEAAWYSRWWQHGCFRPELGSNKPTFTITIPPPNITGSLHMGHTLCYPVQDLIGRYRRLRGDNVLILPGQDHAGIATQSVVSKQLKAEGISPTQLGREKFVEKVWQWREKSGGMILHGFRRMGCGFDWDRERFTLDERYVRAVLTIFIDWFERGLIYRGKRVVNWDPVLQTSVSDIETERKQHKGKLYYIRYPFVDGSGEVTIATTRPETMLADVAVAVHPSDKRYTGLIGKNLRLPLMNREIPLIADTYPDPEFGSGAVKITPAHDPNDYEVGVRHKLEMPMMMDEQGKVTAFGGPYAGLDRHEARKRVVADLEEQGFLIKIEDHEIPLIVSERSGEVIEPLLSEQWFVKQTELAKPAIQSVLDGSISFVPDRYNRIFLDWMENIRDWNISRKLWWGHRIPIYYAEDGTFVAALSWDEAEKKAGKKIVRQDDEVLDTWFSSGLWPFATLGWPEQTEDLKNHYPTSVLVTDRNIINLWVARMIMMGLDQMKEIPFSKVLIHPTVLTEDGRRMSKSLGTGVDPEGVIDRVGADSLRYTLLSQAGSNQDIRYSEKRVDEARNFCNKIWNAARFLLMNLDEVPSEPGHLEDVDKWILSRLAATEAIARNAYDGFEMQDACQGLYRFFWSELCDWYIEVSKPRLNDPQMKKTPQWVLLRCFEAFLTMMHPVMPFITEEIYEKLPVQKKPDSPFIMHADWPSDLGKWRNEAIEHKIDRALAITRALRALRAELEIPAMTPAAEAYFVGDLAGVEDLVASQAWITTLKAGKPTARSISSSVEDIEIYLPFGEGIDVDKILQRLQREQEKLTKDATTLDARLNSPDFISRAKPEVVERDRELRESVAKQLEQTRERIKLFS
ncbi:MAG: valine--tRNA ligase [Armatimonadetes bacterium]|nr:valine--tRNA ligase [Armatimonadota bacterium]